MESADRTDGMWHNTMLRATVVILAMAAGDAAGTAAELPEGALARKIIDGSGVRGGLVVHVGCGGGRLTAALRVDRRFLVHGLETDADRVTQARTHIDSLGLGGAVSVDRWTGKRLPLIDNLVNLLVSERPLSVSSDEVLRVLAPGGVAYVQDDGRWTKTVKPWPEEIDQWTHFLHDASGNAVAKDTRVGPPRHVQWTATPTWSRYHHTLASISSVVSAGGRVFYIVDEGSAASMQVPGKWSVAARDAFNGVLLWKRSIPSWAWHRKGFRSGPVQLPRTLVAGNGCVYVPLGLGAAVSSLDAATGDVLRTYQPTEGAEEILLDDGLLLVVTGSPMAEQAAIGRKPRSPAGFPNEKSIVAVRAKTGELVWKRSQPASARLMPLTLAAAGARVFFQAGNSIVSLGRETGEELWTWRPRGRKRDRQKRKVGWSVATLVVAEGVVLWSDGKQLAALSTNSGNLLWQTDSEPGFRSPVDLFAVGGLVWTGPEFSQGRDLKTGNVKRTSTAVRDVWTIGHHHRCYREKATVRYILTGKRGIEFLDLVSGSHTRNNWVRGTCQYGIMPCNGLVYAPSHACGCFMEAKLHGFWALAPARKAESGKPKTENASRLERGPAYDRGIHHPSSIIHDPGDWPTHRRDALRSGSTPVEVARPLRQRWTANVGGRLSAPVVAGRTVVVSSVDAHRVVALDAASGKTRWTFATGGRVDSPPTIHDQLVLFGCSDGWVHALRLADGRLAWRFLAAPAELKTVAQDRVESVWPVHGSVLVQGGVAYVTAGRSSYLDGGIVLRGLDPVTGKLLSSTRVCTAHPTSGGENAQGITSAKIDQNATDFKTFTDPDRSDAFSMGGATTDVLVGDGTAVYLRQLKFDRRCVEQKQHGRHLLSTSGLLDDAENHRSHWILGGGDFSRLPVAYSWIANSPNGRKGWRLAVPYGILLVFDDETVWGVRRTKGFGYRLFAEANRPLATDEEPPADFQHGQGKVAPEGRWSVDAPIRPRAMVRAGGAILLGGMPLAENPAELAASYEGRRGGVLWVASASDGSELARQELDSPPVFDGMAVAGGRLYLCTVDGKVLCLGPTGD